MGLLAVACVVGCVVGCSGGTSVPARSPSDSPVPVATDSEDVRALLARPLAMPSLPAGLGKLTPEADGLYATTTGGYQGPVVVRVGRVVA